MSTDASRAVPRRSRIFYGWYVLGASVVIELFGLGFGIFAITTVYPYIVDTFPEWPRTIVFLPTSVVIMTVAVMGPLTGAFIDRYSIRYLFVSGIVIQTCALFLFSYVQTPAQYLGTSFLLGIGMSGVTILPNQVLVSRWFYDRVGLVNGIILAATATGAAISPALLTRLIEASDWRTAFHWMALAACALPLLVVVTIVRDRPEAMGLQPYGAVQDAGRAAVQRSGWTVADAIRSLPFWVFAAAVFFGGMPCYSYNKHILVQLKELGYAPIEAADYKSFFFIVAACARLSFGWLCDRFNPRDMTLLHFVLIATGASALLLVPSRPHLLLPTLVVFGIGYGGLLPAIPILTVSFFGRAHLGALLGVYKIGYDIAAASAPLITAYLYDRFGGYTVAQVLLTACAWIGVALILFGLTKKRLEAGGL